MKQVIFLLILLTSAASVFGQSIDQKRRDGREMLQKIKVMLEDNYYDRTFNGVDLNSSYKALQEKIDTANSNSEIAIIVASFVLQLNDSHTHFLPPERLQIVDYGVSMMFVNDVCYITNVSPGSDAEKKGLKRGDIITRIRNVHLTRHNLATMMYLTSQLSPTNILDIHIIDNDGQETNMVIDAKWTPRDAWVKEREKREKDEDSSPYKCNELSKETLMCQLKTFSTSSANIAKMMREVRGYKKLLLDLRSNSGGRGDTMQNLIGYFYQKQVNVGEDVSRGKVKIITVTPSKSDNFDGELIILTDSRTASAAEIFARLAQIEKRGKVIGDVSSGSVMGSRLLLNNFRANSNWSVGFFGLNVTVSELIMSDGKSLEKAGVFPDISITPSQKDIIEGNDPVLAYAAQTLGVNISAKEAAELRFLSY